ncbi:hypothetical protein ThrDRAFT_03262 [Frankia casuarinae]|uniref:DUF4267 domain-containing protein n=1 Tax=Frankia casuarinae (strain DSM 45818 / CECT 9043 / HFP020203 / CcI3) TaxID=106370 RepID=Q2JAQ5_FRACC|nr:MULTISPECIES: hypothetical protein [Frankia]ABD11637.1 hypothetical protein Francci3_2269 [Frankia casuarinae]ETA01343.1 hypothetical protein CcI6DRAFT_03210 [Frankia sp. CcI6]EYT91084.1 hypothetical protein ThrDRAFT_03262 [Frankia casuarinae]KDA42509.1 hypothetical protein BMG523Draft_02623 [Frankia sp. BMG5.23]KEZ35619.1 hypothetical protein CEDDRAFT_03054 [Frankia sp. CeD]
MNTQRSHSTTKYRTAHSRTLHTTTLGITRATIGILALSRPVDIIRLTGVDRVTAGRLAWLARLAGIRDLALGTGLLHALITRRDTTTWLWTGMIADAADVAVLATATTRGELPPMIGTAMTTAALGGVTAAVPLALPRHHPNTDPPPTIDTGGEHHHPAPPTPTRRKAATTP